MLCLKSASLLFKSRKAQNLLRLATMLSFVFLTAKKLFSGLSVLSLNVTLIYFTIFLLLAARVKYKYLLIPDTALLSIKLFITVKSVYELFIIHSSTNEYIKVLAISKIIDNLLFSLFLIILISAKLLHFKKLSINNYPIICISILIVRIITVTLLEAVLISLKAEDLTIFYIFQKLLAEVLYNIPYFLLLLLIAFVPE